MNYLYYSITYKVAVATGADFRAEGGVKGSKV
jgi:hypothetical protein